MEEKELIKKYIKKITEVEFEKHVDKLMKISIKQD